MNLFKFFLVLLLVPVQGYAQSAAAPFNQILFSETEQSWTSRDLSLYEKLMSLVLNKKKLSPYTQTRSEEFLLSRLSYREAILFGVTPEKIKLSDADRKKLFEYSTQEVDEEMKRLGALLALLDIKDNQLKQKERFTTWFDHLKRKYQVKLKAIEP